MFSELYIDDYCNFNTFKMDFVKHENNASTINLKLLVGKNGSGKSSLLDALFEIGRNNLRENLAEKVDNTSFNYKLYLGNKLIVSNPRLNNEEYLTDDDIKNNIWDAVVRLHTGHTKRQFESHDANVYTFTTQNTKWALFAYITSGLWHHQNDEDKKLWTELQDIIFGKDNHIEPKIIWVDIENYDKTDIAGDFDSEVIKGIRNADSHQDLGNNITRFFWNLDDPIEIQTPGAGSQPTINPLPGLATFLSRLDPIKISYNMSGKLIDTGFLYTQGPNSKYLPDKFLSDGEHGFLTRFALLMVLKEENKHNTKHFLILLDEPETHFNENWKTYFLSLICKIFQDSTHDIFIATHSAMLVSDAKADEIHRLENRTSGIINYPVPINTYGANVVDIGKTLFQMESDIGDRARTQIENTLKGYTGGTASDGQKIKFESIEEHKHALETLKRQVGAGEWRWRIRAKLNELEKRENCIFIKSQNNEE